MPAPVITSKTLNAVLATPTVQKALRARAELMLPRARRAASDAGALAFASRLTVRSGVRPGTKSRTGLKRPYARVVADMPPPARDQDARARKSRRAILREAARG